MKKMILLAACLAAPMLAHAGCEDFFPAWAKTLAPGRTSGVAQAVCQAWPANPALTLGVMTFLTDGPQRQDGVEDLLLLVADSKSGAVSAHLLQPSGLSFDTMHGTDFTLDTGRYQLTPSVRAFGIRVPQAGASLHSPASSEDLTLYVVDGATLRPVLERLQTSMHDATWNGDCTDSATDTTRTISIGAPGKDGYADLLVLEQTKNTSSGLKKGRCEDNPVRVQRKRYTLRYGDGLYVVPQSLAY